MTWPTCRVGRPQGLPTAGNFAFVEEAVPVPGPGPAPVENIYLSVDPCMREVMDEGGWDLHAPLDGRAIGRVVESHDPAPAVGGLVRHRVAWHAHALVTAAGARVLPDLPGVPRRATSACSAAPASARTSAWRRSPASSRGRRCSSRPPPAASAPRPVRSPGCSAPGASSAAPDPPPRSNTSPRTNTGKAIVQVSPV
ncbi:MULTISPECIES: hypothetical protein [Streptomyces]|uniref:hypothetical protein n=1 Tax=Streptomyces TaxID=1883 RepID=UPI003610E016